jgi:BASS family bile acid:Na+ symporter
MPDWLLTLIKTVARIAVPLLAFASGLQTARAELRWLYRRPALLLRSLLAVLLLVPAAALLLVTALRLPYPVPQGLLIISIAIGPVAALTTSKKRGGEESYALGLDALLLVLSVVFVPAAAAVLGALFGRTVRLKLGEVAKVVGVLQLLPLLAGVAVRRFWPRVADRLQRPVSLVATVLFVGLVVVVLALLARPMVAIGARGLLATGTLAVAAVLIGHLLAGPDVRHRQVLAAFCALRFPALALLLAAVAGPGPKVVPVVLAYVLASTLAVGISALAEQAIGHRRRLPNQVEPFLRPSG